MGADPTHLNYDKENALLYISNYNGGNFVAYSINADGSIGDIGYNTYIIDFRRESC